MNPLPLHLRLRDRLARLIGRDQHHFGAPDSPLPEDAPLTSLIEELGLIEDATPVRERPGWHRPELALVTNVSPARLAWLQDAAADVELVRYDNAEQALAVAPRADAIIGWHTPEIIDRAARLQWIQVQTAGVENAIANPDIRTRGILVTSLKRVAAPVIAEHVFACMLASSRRLGDFAELQRRRRWSQAPAVSHELGALRGRMLVVAGGGGIGSAVARLGHAFGMRAATVAGDLTPRASAEAPATPSGQLASALADADFVVNALPLTDRTRGLFDRAMFDRFKPGAMFVNVGRGETVVTDALTQALASGRVGSAALDVIDPEPLPPGHPLWRMPQLIVTPHVAGVGGATTHWGWQVARENLRRYAAGERMLSVVDLERGY